MADVMLAAENCVTAGAKVISISLSCGEKETDIERCYTSEWDDQFQRIYDQNVLIIGAVGNTGNASNEHPGAYKTVMTVSAVDEQNMWYDESTRNNQVEIAAPGV